MHPGEILINQYLAPAGLSQNRLARDIGVPPRRINEIVLGKRSITADTAVRLATYFGNEALDWLRLQSEYDIALARATNHSDYAAIQRAGVETETPVAPRPATVVRGTIRKRLMR